MPEVLDKEIEALRTVLNALEPLDHNSRVSVIEYVTKRLQISVSSGSASEASELTRGGATSPSTTSGPDQSGPSVTHIKDLKEQKRPRSANEMAALVAYYLGELAPSKDRKTTINTKDVETYFKISEFPLPGHVRMTLPSAKAAGYFDAVGDGDYRLNAVGYNLVVHSMPRGSGPDSKPKRNSKKKPRPSAKKR